MRKKRYPSIFDIFENFTKGMPFDERGDFWRTKDPFEELIKKFEENVSGEYKEMIKEETPSGEVKRYGPFVYGFSYTSEPGKEPVFREFGNIKPTTFGGIQPSTGREPFVDVMEEESNYKICVELPGVEKENIKLDATEDHITIETTDEKKYHKAVPLDSAIDPDSSNASYKNGVLSIVVEKKEKPKKGKEIKID